jgi:hypothetical protein
MPSLRAQTFVTCCRISSIGEALYIGCSIIALNRSTSFFKAFPLGLIPTSIFFCFTTLSSAIISSNEFPSADKFTFKFFFVRFRIFFPGFCKRSSTSQFRERKKGGEGNSVRRRSAERHVCRPWWVGLRGWGRSRRTHLLRTWLLRRQTGRLAGFVLLAWPWGCYSVMEDNFFATMDRRHEAIHLGHQRARNRLTRINWALSFRSSDHCNKHINYTPMLLHLTQPPLPIYLSPPKPNTPTATPPPPEHSRSKTAHSPPHHDRTTASFPYP